MNAFRHWLHQNRTLAVVLGLVIVLVGGYVLYWLTSPLFVNEVVDEGFPSEVMEATMDAAASAPATVMEEPMPDQASEAALLLNGEFRDADSFHMGSGLATIYELASGRVLRFENFDVTNGPDLRVLLSTNPNPTSRDDIGDYVDLGSLKGNQGNQNYDIPADLDLSQYQSVVIYCMPFHVVFSVASLNQ